MGAESTTSAVPGVEGGGESEDWDTECFTESEIQAGYHQLALQEESIVIVDTPEKYTQCMKHITQVGDFGLYWLQDWSPSPYDHSC